MNKMVQGVKQFLNDEEGVTAIEYGLIAALVAVAIIAGLNALSGGLNAIFNHVAGLLNGAI